MNDAIQNKLLGAADQLTMAANSITQELIKKAPDALNLILTVAKYTALCNLIQGFACFIGVLLIIRTGYFFIRKTDDMGGDWELALALHCYLGTIGAIILLILGIINFFDIFSWIGIWHPDVYIAHQLLQKVIS